MGPPPVCYESGMTGACSFTSTQLGYNFYLYSQNATGLTNLGNLTVIFTADYT